MSNMTDGSGRLDHEVKVRRREELAAYYGDKLGSFGLESLARFVRYHPAPSALMKRGVTYAHQGIETVAQAMGEGSPWAVVSGLNPSGPLHFGHKQVLDELLWCQRQGAEIYIPVANDETYVVGKSASLAESRNTAYNDVIPSIIAMGFDAKHTHIFVDSDFLPIYNVAMDLSKTLTLHSVSRIFGFAEGEHGENPGVAFYRGGVQLAHILLPQYPDFGGPKPTLIPVGLDQHPYILLARDVARKRGLVPPAALVMRFLEGLDGRGKMSASRPEGTVFLTDPPEAAERRLRSAYTGGSATAALHRELGGVSEVCGICQLRMWHFSASDRHNACEVGAMLCGESKRETIHEVVEFLEEHQRALPAARSRMREFMLESPVSSLLVDPITADVDRVSIGATGSVPR